MRGYHCDLNALLGIHFPESLETFDSHSATGNLQNLLLDLRNGKQRMRNRFLAFAFDQLEDGAIAGRVMINFHTFSSRLGDTFFDGSGFVSLDQPTTSACSIRSRRRLA